MEYEMEFDMYWAPGLQMYLHKALVRTKSFEVAAFGTSQFEAAKNVVALVERLEA